MIRDWTQRWLQMVGFGAPAQPPQTPIWVAWADIVRRFPLWWYVTSGFRPGRQRWAAMDDISRIRAGRRVTAALIVLDGYDETTLQQLAAVARANVDRHAYFSRLILLAYFTVPLTVGAVLAQLAPVWLNHILITYASTIGGGFAGAAVAVVVRLIAEARARQIVTIVGFALIERGIVAG